MHLTETDFRLQLFIIVVAVARCRLETYDGILFLLEIYVAGLQAGQFEITVHLSAPAPVDVELTVLIAMQHERVACLTAEATVDDGASGLDLIIEQLLPLLVGKLLTAQNIGTLTEIEEGDECSGNTTRSGT